MTKINKLQLKELEVTCPTRIDFTGGFTDVSPFREENWANHINLAINLLVKVFIRLRKDKKIKILDSKGNLQKTYESYQSVSKKSFPLLWAVLKSFQPKNGFELLIEIKAPTGAGLGTSGALSVALVAAMQTITGMGLPQSSPSELAALGAKIEKVSGALGGLQDQFAAASGGLNYFRFYRNKHSIEPIKLSPSQIELLTSQLLIIYPGGKRHSSDIVMDIMTAYQKHDVSVLGSLESLNELALEVKEALKSFDLEKLAILLQKIQTQQLKLHSNIVDISNKKIIKNLKEKGIIGVKLLGGGGGGACLLAICKKELRLVATKIIKEQNATILPVRCSPQGVKIEI